jgi:hypothetical protein
MTGSEKVNASKIGGGAVNHQLCYDLSHMGRDLNLGKERCAVVEFLGLC